MSFLRLTLAALALAASFGSAQALNPQPEPPGYWKAHGSIPQQFGLKTQLRTR